MKNQDHKAAPPPTEYMVRKSADDDFGTTQNTSNKSVTRSRKLRSYMILILPVIGLLFLGLKSIGYRCAVAKDIRKALGGIHVIDAFRSSSDICPQVDILVPSKSKDLWTELNEEVYSTDSYKKKLAEELGGAVRHQTESHDSAEPVGVDPRWEVFGGLNDYLEATYPLIHTTLEITKVNTYALLYYWKGSNSTLKPLLLAAHQDVVPVNPDTVDEWIYPPYSGYFDGQYIWGRGSSDDKSGLIAIMNTIEGLIKRGFQPTRSVVLAFGIDEETSGRYGAYELGQVMLEKFGENSMAMLVDEGGGFRKQYGAVIAEVAVGEKGYLDMLVEVTSPGGHSSIPPPHTSIGILSALLVKYEAEAPPTHLDRDIPFYGTIQCLAAHAPDLPKKLRRAVKKSVKSDHALKKVEKMLSDNKDYKARISTTQAVDLIGGGVKVNALPEQAWAVVNHRIMTQSSVEAVKDRATKLLHNQANKFNLTYNAFGKTIISDKKESKYGSLTLTDAWDTFLDPAPITPTGTDAAPYQLLSGTIKTAYDVRNKGSGSSQKADDIIVAPGIMTGNTDTRYYWNLTKHIFRYNHHDGVITDLPSGVHTVNERTDINALVGQVTFFTTLIMNADESTTM